MKTWKYALAAGMFVFSAAHAGENSKLEAANAKLGAAVVQMQVHLKQAEADGIITKSEHNKDLNLLEGKIKNLDSMKLVCARIVDSSDCVAAFTDATAEEINKLETDLLTGE